MLEDQCRVVPCCILQAALPTLIPQNPREELTDCSLQVLVSNGTRYMLELKFNLPNKYLNEAIGALFLLLLLLFYPKQVRNSEQYNRVKSITFFSHESL